MVQSSNLLRSVVRRLGWSNLWSGRRRRVLRGSRVSVTGERLEVRQVLAAGLSGSVVDAEGNLQFWKGTDSIVVDETSGGALAPTGIGGAGGDVSSAPPFPLTETFNLSSRPNSNYTIYLDFNGHVSTGTTWSLAFPELGNSFTTTAYTLDADLNFSNLELENIQRIWQIVAEDMAPFDVNVTTIDPGVEKLRNTGGSDTQWGMRAIVGDGGPAFDAAGGIAFLNSFDGSTDVGCFTYQSNRGDTNLSVANTISHEVGHTFGLDHDGRTSPVEEYFDGHGSGVTAWGPIMGSGFGVPLDPYRVFHWSRGEYANSSNTEDDLSIITTNNGFGFRPDDVGNTTTTAQLLAPATVPVVIGTGVELLASGVIETRTDVDLFRLVTSGGAVTIDLSNLSDSPNLDVELALLDSTGAVTTVVNPANALNASLSTNLAAGTYYIRVDGVGFGDPLTNGYTDYGSIGVYNLRVVAPVNNPPVIAPQSFSVAENSAVGTVVGRVAATDPDGNTFRFSITGGNPGSTFAIDPVTGEITVASNQSLDFETTPVFRLTVSALDNGSPPATGTGTITVNLSNVNEPGTRLTLAPNRVQEGQPVGTVVGTLSTDDPDAGDTFTYAFVSGTGDSHNSLFRINGDKLETNQVLDFEGAPTLFVRMRATDSGNNSFEDLFAIVVGNVNEAPTNINLFPITTPAFREDATPGTNMASFTAVDSDIGDTATFTLVTGDGATDNGLFTLTGGVLQLVGTLDFETRPTLSIRVRATDAAAATFERSFTINVSNVNEAPNAPTLSNGTVVEDVGGAVVGTLSATDPDGVGPLFFTIASGLNGAEFTIVGNELRAGAAGIDFEAGATRQVRIRVADLGGLITSQTFTINVLNTNEEVTITSTSIAENSPLGTPVGTLSTSAGTTPFVYSLVTGDGAADNGLFAVVGDQLQTNTSLDFETRKTYSVRVKSTPATGGPFERVFTIGVTDQPENPTDIALSLTSGARENDVIGREVGTLSGTDPDAGSSFTFSLVDGAGSDDNSRFNITGGNRLVAAAVFDRELKPTLSVRVRVTDNTGRTFDKVFAIEVANVNEPPTRVSFAAGGNVPENVASFLVGNITSDDPDLADNISFRLAPRDQSSGLKDDSFLFEIRNGNQVFTRLTPLDFEAGRSLTIWVRATDSANLFVETSVTINVTDANDAPTFLSLNGGTVTENVTGQKTVGSLSTSDPDAVDTFAYTLVASPTGSNDNGLFSLIGNQLVTTQTFNAEARPVYFVRVRSTDKGGQTIESDFRINVVNVNEPPVNIRLSNASVSENRAAGTAVGTLTAFDPEGDEPIFDLIPGPGDGSNGLFRIDGDVLRTDTPLDYETAKTHSLRIRARDLKGAVSVQNFTIEIGDDGAPIRFLRAHNRRADYHFYTIQPSEFEFVVRQAGFRDETTNQPGFNVLGDRLEGAAGIHRLYNFQTQRHYYTTNSAERDILVGIIPTNHPKYGEVGWRYERDEGFVFPIQMPGTVAIQRLYNNVSGVHLYTESIGQRDAILRQFPGIWVSHGILGYGYPVAFVPSVSQPATAAAATVAEAPVSVPSVSAAVATEARVETLIAAPQARSASATSAASAAEGGVSTSVRRSTAAAPSSSQATGLDDAFRMLATGGLDIDL
jgi:hypothetical protein